MQYLWCQIFCAKHNVFTCLAFWTFMSFNLPLIKFEPLSTLLHFHSVLSQTRAFLSFCKSWNRGADFQHFGAKTRVSTVQTMLDFQLVHLCSRYWFSVSPARPGAMCPVLQFIPNKPLLLLPEKQQIHYRLVPEGFSLLNTEKTPIPLSVFTATANKKKKWKWL